MEETYAIAIALLQQGLIPCIVRHDDHFDIVPADINLSRASFEALEENDAERMYFQTALCVKASEMVEEAHDA